MSRTVSLKRLLGLLFLGALILYPLRAVNVGVDLWDAGYNYSNFRFPGTNYMDSMWYFATWIATLTGSLIMKLPGAGTMVGMNVYTGLFVSLLATAGFLFCQKTLKLPAWVGFLTELAAISLCWIPTASLYNYMTFLVFACGVILLYKGIIVENDKLLLAAGVLLGLNVGVRFSNLVQAALILGLWLYGGLRKRKFQQVFRQTLVCIAGYLLGLAIFLVPIILRYGISAYIESISRLFAMTETAQDYTPTSMLTGILDAAAESSYWLKRIILAAGVLLAICIPFPGKGKKVKRAACTVIIAGTIFWLWKSRFFFPDFAAYTSVYRPCVAFVLAAMGVSLLVLLRKSTTPEDKLFACLEILILFLTSLGGNNAVFYCMNNLFLALPIFVYLVVREWKTYRKMELFGVSALASALAVLMMILAIPYGLQFHYEEAAGGRELNTAIAEVPVLKGMKTNPAKAEQLEKLFAYLQGSGETDGILYGQIPGVAYYCELTPAMNIWSDLDSVSVEEMRRSLNEVKQRNELPIIIVETGWVNYLEREAEANPLWTVPMYEKARILWDFKAENGYKTVWESEKFTIYKEIK